MDRPSASADVESIFEVEEVLERNHKAMLVEEDASDFGLCGLICSGDEEHVAEDVAFDSGIHHDGVNLIDVVL